MAIPKMLPVTRNFLWLFTVANVFMGVSELCLTTTRAQDKQRENFETQQNVLRNELLDRMESQPEICFPRTPVDVRVKIENSESFGKETLVTDRSAIRYIFDFGRERLFLAYRANIDSSEAKTVARLQLGAVSIVESRLAEHVPDGMGWKTRVTGSMKATLKTVEAPLPFFHAVMDYPSYNAADSMTKQTIDAIAGPSNDVSVQVNEDNSLRYAVDIKHEPGRYDRWSWTFDAASGVLTHRSVDRAIDSVPRRYLDCKLNWSVDAAGNPRLDDMLTTSLAIRSQEGFVNGRQLGKHYCAVEFEYQPISESVADQFTPAKLSTAASLIDFVSVIK